MPLRDHFHPPLTDLVDWDGLHGAWPTILLLNLRKSLPPRYVAAPHVHLGSSVEIDVGTYEREGPEFPPPGAGNGHTYAPAQPTVAVVTDLLAADEYELRIFDTKAHRRLVAAVEIVSPSNKDRPGTRSAFVAKCAGLLRKGVSVSIVDVVTSHHFNLYTDLLDLTGNNDPTMGEEPPHIYAASCRWVPRRTGRILETWSEILAVGRPLPSLPLWLADNFAVPLDLETTYEETCHALDIP